MAGGHGRSPDRLDRGCRRWAPTNWGYDVPNVPCRSGPAWPSSAVSVPSTRLGAGRGLSGGRAADGPLAAGRTPVRRSDADWSSTTPTPVRSRRTAQLQSLVARFRPARVIVLIDFPRLEEIDEVLAAGGRQRPGKTLSDRRSDRLPAGRPRPPQPRLLGCEGVRPGPGSAMPGVETPQGGRTGATGSGRRPCPARGTGTLGLAPPIKSPMETRTLTSVTAPKAPTHS